jgi:hypothetical protein
LRHKIRLEILCHHGQMGAREKYLQIASANIDNTTWYFNFASVTLGRPFHDPLFPLLEMASERFDGNFLLVKGVNHWLSTYPFATTG